MTFIIKILAVLLMAVMLGGAGCLQLGATEASQFQGAPYQSGGTSTQAIAGAFAVMENQTVAYGHPGANFMDPIVRSIGPGTAEFRGFSLIAFSSSGDLTFHAAPGQLELSGAKTQTSEEFLNSVSATSERLITWGSWSAPAGIEDFQGISNHGLLHYIIGQQTPVTNFPQSSGIAHYKLIGNSVTGSVQNFVANEDSGARKLHIDGASLSVLWGTGTPKIGLDVSAIAYDFPFGNTVRIQTTGGVADPANSELSLRIGSATFGSSLIPVDPCGTYVSCTASAEGFLAGPNAERAAVSFGTKPGGPRFAASTTGTDYLFGVLAFGFDTFGSGSVSGSGGSGGFTAPLDTSSPPLAIVYAGPGGGLVDQSTDVTAITQDGTTGLITSYTKTGIDTFINNTAQGAELGGDALITWGRWTNGTSQMLGTGGPPSNTVIGAEQGFHYVIGKPSPSLPATGTATFTLLGATKPTFGDGTMAAGTLASAAMAVEWGGTAATKVGVNMTVTMPGDASYQIVSTGGTTTPGTSEISTGGNAMFSGFDVPVTGGARACNGGACAANISGLFTGTDGARAGLVYTVKRAVGPPISATSIVGAATFSKQ